MLRVLSRDARYASSIMYSAIPRVGVRISPTRYLAAVTHCSNSLSSLLNSQKSFINTNKIYLSTQPQEASSGKQADETLYTLISDNEKAKGPADHKQFQAETRKLLDIVAHSLYSSKEVFLRELISNSSDALEKLRHMQMSAAADDKAKELSTVDQQLPLEIHIATDEKKGQLIIQDTGVGMTKEELIQNLGVIAHSGSQKFVKELEGGAKSDAVRNMIGQFGVGFYSAFMVADRLDVYSQSFKPGEPAFKWTSDGSGSYDISEAEGVKRGTKIVIHLKKDCQEYAKESTINEIIHKYSNFIGVPVFLNGKRSNIVQAIWLLHPKEITTEMHEAFYRFIAGANDKPRFTFHFQSDSPLTVRALFYVSDGKPNFFEMSRDTDISVSLYSRRVLILHRANTILPRWLRFMKGVVDCEDIPLNLSREMLQDGIIVRKLRDMLTSRACRFLHDQSRRDPAKYQEFYRDFGVFIKEGVISSQEQELREDVAKLLLFESSALPPGEKTTLPEYCKRMKLDDKKIYYFAAPSRSLAESSPYYEAMRDRKTEVLFATDTHDDLVLLQLAQFDKKQLVSIENDSSAAQASSSGSEKSATADDPKKPKPVSLSEEDTKSMIEWLKATLGFKKVANVRSTDRLSSHPCVVTVTEMSSARHMVKSLLADKSDEEKVQVLQPTLEINPSHPIVRKLFQVQKTDEKTAKLLAEQLYNNALIAAALVDDPRRLLVNINELLTALLEKLPSDSSSSQTAGDATKAAAEKPAAEKSSSSA